MQSSVRHPRRDEGDRRTKSGSDTKKRKDVGMIKSSLYLKLSKDCGYERNALEGSGPEGLDSDLHCVERVSH